MAQFLDIRIINVPSNMQESNSHTQFPYANKFDLLLMSQEYSSGKLGLLVTAVTYFQNTSHA